MTILCVLLRLHIPCSRSFAATDVGRLAILPMSSSVFEVITLAHKAMCLLVCREHREEYEEYAKTLDVFLRFRDRLLG